MAVLTHELLQPDGILVLRPQDPLEAADFQNLAKEIDPFIESNGKLHGILRDAEAFPGWKNFVAFLAHLRFVRDHHRTVEKVAAVSDNTFLAVAPKVASHFVQAEVRHFPRAEREQALAWLKGAG